MRIPMPRQNSIRVRNDLVFSVGIAFYVETGESETLVYRADLAADLYLARHSRRGCTAFCVAIKNRNPRAEFRQQLRRRRANACGSAGNHRRPAGKNIPSLPGPLRRNYHIFGARGRRHVQPGDFSILYVALHCGLERRMQLEVCRPFFWPRRQQ